MKEAIKVVGTSDLYGKAVLRLFVPPSPNSTYSGINHIFTKVPIKNAVNTGNQKKH